MSAPETGSIADQTIVNLLGQILANIQNGTASGSIDVPFKGRINTSGVQVYNSDTGKYHTLLAQGAAGSVYLTVDQTGEA